MVIDIQDNFPFNVRGIFECKTCVSEDPRLNYDYNYKGDWGGSFYKHCPRCDTNNKAYSHEVKPTTRGYYDCDNCSTMFLDDNMPPASPCPKCGMTCLLVSPPKPGDPMNEEQKLFIEGLVEAIVNKAVKDLHTKHQTWQNNTSEMLREFTTKIRDDYEEMEEAVAARDPNLTIDAVGKILEGLKDLLK